MSNHHTVKRNTLPLNKGKLDALRNLIDAYSKEKQHWIIEFEKEQLKINQPRTIRDEAVKAKYKTNLQARTWKLALNDASETWNRHWKAIFQKIRPLIHAKKDLNQEDKHYLFWLLCGDQFFACIQGQTPLPKFNIPAERCKKLASYLRRIIKRKRGNNPTVRIARSAVLDTQCYSVFEEKGNQYISIMSQQKGKRIIIPLLGKTGIHGNIKVILEKDNTVTVHIGFEFNTLEITEGNDVGIDKGYTEAFVDDQNNAYGKGLGTILNNATDHRHITGKRRNKIRPIAKKTKNKAKRRRIKKFNLGNKKWNKKEKAVKASIDREVNTGLNQMCKTRGPIKRLGSEHLSHTFSFTRGAKTNRKLSNWVRGTHEKRVQFKAEVKGFHVLPVNAAYSSQSCPLCDFTDSRNRKGNNFLCRVCGHVDHADCVGGKSAKRRMDDPQITRWTPYCEVKTILMERHHRWLETRRDAEAQASVKPSNDCSQQDSRN